MATIKLVILPHATLKDGSNKIRIAVNHQGITRYIPTHYKVDSPSQFRDGQVLNRPDAHTMNIKLRNLLNDYEERLYNISSLHLYSCTQLKELLHNGSKPDTPLTFQAVCNEYISELRQDKRDNYATLLERNCRYFTAFCKGDILLASITPYIIQNYVRYLKKNYRMNDTTIDMFISRTRTILNRAKKQNLVHYEVEPTSIHKIQASPERELDITVQELQKIRDSSPDTKRLIAARDLLMLSYYLGGVNLIDLLSYDFRNASRFEYIRIKSRNTKMGDKRISITIPPEASPIIERWMNRNTGKLDFGYKFSYSNFSRYINRSIKALAKSLQIKSKVTYYSARKSFVQHGFELGVPLEVLEYCIGQSMKKNRPIFNYLRIMRDHADKAIRIILDNLI